MRAGPPVLPGSSELSESPADRALSLAMAEERDAALRWAASIVSADPGMATALCLCGRLLGELGRKEVAREACGVAVERAVDLENLPLAVIAAKELERFGGDPSSQLNTIATAFCKGSKRRGEGASPPQPLPNASDFQPLPSVLSGAALINKVTGIVRDAKKKLAAMDERPGISARPLFSSLDEKGLRALCEAMEPAWVAADTKVIQQGQVGTSAFFVARGELAASRDRKGSDPMPLGRLTGGSIFGEMALLSRAPRSGSVTALRPSLVVEVSKSALEGLTKTHPEVGEELATHCRDRMFQNLVKMSEVMRVVPAADRPALVERFRTVTFEKNDRLMLQDEPPEGLHLIASGEVAVVRREPEETGGSGDPLVLSTLGMGDVVGEIAMVLRRKSECEVVALHPTVTLFLPAEDFMGLIHDHPSILAELYLLAVARDEEHTSIMAEEASAAENFVLI